MPPEIIIPERDIEKNNTNAVISMVSAQKFITLKNPLSLGIG